MYLRIFSDLWLGRLITLLNPSYQLRIATLSDVRASGTEGPLSVIGQNTRVLQTIVDTTGLVTSLVSNQFVLPAGTYYFEGAGVSYNNTGYTRLRIRNITDSVTSVLGLSTYNANTNIQYQSVLVGEVVITSAKTFELQHYTSASQRFGLSLTMGESEVFAQLKITKIK